MPSRRYCATCFWKINTAVTVTEVRQKAPKGNCFYCYGCGAVCATPGQNQDSKIITTTVIPAQYAQLNYITNALPPYNPEEETMQLYTIAVTQKRPTQTVKTTTIGGTTLETSTTEEQADELILDPMVVVTTDATTAYNAAIAKAALKPNFKPDKARVWVTPHQLGKAEHRA